MMSTKAPAPEKEAPKESNQPKAESIHGFFKRVPMVVKIRLIGLVVGVFVTLVAGVMISWKIMTLNREPTLAEKLLAETHNAEGPPAAFAMAYEIKDVAVHFASKETDRLGYAQFGLTFDMPSRDAVHYMELNRARALDIIFEIAADYALEDMRTPDGYKNFRVGLRERFAKAFGQHSPRDVAIKDWLMN